MSESSRKQRVILVGIGGATCSGKTTLAKHLKACIPNSIIIHQDDFAPPQELVPIHPVYNVQDWDDPAGAIDWKRLRSFLGEVKSTGVIPEEHMSHDHLNEQKDIPLDPTVFKKWKDEFTKLKNQFEKNEENTEIIWGLVDGFLLYWDEEVVDALDSRIFLRTPHEVLKKRRHERHGYHTAVQSDPEGSLWRDPPNYFEQIVYPAYLKAHARIFKDGDTDNGDPTDKVENLLVINTNLSDGSVVGMDEIFDRASSAILEASRRTESTYGTQNGA